VRGRYRRSPMAKIIRIEFTVISKAVETMYRILSIAEADPASWNTLAAKKVNKTYLGRKILIRV
jgi:hypothetical protein